VAVFRLYIIFLFSVFSFSQNTGFHSHSSESTDIRFENSINETEKVNIVAYDYLYNGAGVGVGDFNNDGLMDLFFAGNFVNDELYFNQGDFRFKNVTTSAGIDKNGWSSGVCIFDVNNDGFEDIYVSRSGPNKDVLTNVLYENQGDGTFKEAAKKYGLDISNHSTQVAPLDIDLDGDLDLYIMGHPKEFNKAVDYQDISTDINEGNVETDLLLENVGGKYIDITTQAGILEFGYGLGLAISDVNQDSYPDIIVCNDFDEPDHLFINQQNNTFKDENLRYFKHTSNYSMGNDVGDFNNDGLMDYVSVDMAFNDHKRSKMNMASMNLNKFYTRVQLGWGYQYMHNMLQLNTGMGSFQEISQFAGVAKTDWSWAPLLFDIDQDGLLDLFVTNGYKRDTKNNDIGHKLDSLKEKNGSVKTLDFLNLIPSVEIENYFFKNNGDLTFKDARADWGIDEKLNSNGAVYVDLDNDGDLDLVLNNVDAPASVYENVVKTTAQDLVVDLSSLPSGLSSGMRVEVETSNNSFLQEHYAVRGYCSSVDPRHFFYAQEGEVFKRLILNDTMYLDLPKKGGLIQPGLKDLKRIETKAISELNKLYFKNLTESSKLDAVYKDNKFNDFVKESLLPHQMSTAGPEIAVGDFDNNGYEDFIVTSSVGKIPTVYLQSSKGTFKKMLSRSFYNHQSSEDADISVFDVNGDEKLDLIISSGGYEHLEGDTAYYNRLYIGNGLGMFGLVRNGMPLDGHNSGITKMSDIDKDGDLDLLVCGKGHPQKYPYAGQTKIYENVKGFFRDKTSIIAPQMERIGMVNDAEFADVDGDGDEDIVLVGEWMDIEIMENVGGKFVRKSKEMNLKGWWSCISQADIDNDGDIDFLCGNAGMNNKYNASNKKPLKVYANDFDNNGTLDIVLSKDYKGNEVPLRGRECSSGQMPFIKDKFPTFLSFANSELEDIYGKEKLEQALQYEVNEFRSGILRNDGMGNFKFEPLPSEAQFSFVNDFEFIDVNGDGRKDIIAVGNRHNTEVETTRYDAGCGLVFLVKAIGELEYLDPTESDFYAPYNAKSLTKIKLANGSTGLLIGNNNERIQLFEVMHRPLSND
jgi:enediyne biosynthesis protein E4